MILCCGEALIDMLPSKIDGITGYIPHTGGSVFNTAIALGRLGVNAGLLTGLSNDLFGERLIAALRESNVDTSNVVFSERPTTLAFVEFVGGNATYSFFDENSAGRMLSPKDLPQLSPQIKGLFFGGISLVLEPCGETYLELAQKEAFGRVICLDPNIRTGFIQDTGRYRRRLEAMIGLADIVKVSDEDVNWIYPESNSLIQKMEGLLEAGPSVIVLTQGKAGATVFSKDGTNIKVRSEFVLVADTVGAGDTFNAGFLAHMSGHGLLSTDALRTAPTEALYEAVRYGNRAAAITVSRPGANPPWSSELEGRAGAALSPTKVPWPRIS
ncbi:carbohydrate kinase family protein [Agrobacterium tumefaciens]|uniref:carbohydrate kinase family protein n=1 Tax=Agrobacterium tumefaciens TaxID=358 RepID=UPI0015716B03|nr:carbohydrate kinase [Agrobacterium tumefaciens]WCK69064.1 carbohydrate kinase [Agrobacterium tumefaciens]